MVNLDGFYPHLQPHHEVQVGNEVQLVVCPITNPDTGQGFQSSWSVNADPSEVDCLFCAALTTRPELLGSDIPCDCDDPPPIGGGAHGGVHHVSEYQPCKVPLRTITWMGVRITVHEGCIASLMVVDDEWVRRGRPAFVRQRDTGAYNCRKTTSGRSWSKHAYGCAIDANWSTNGYGKRTCDHPAWFIAAMKRQGYGHGLDWSGTKDPMHYSKFPNEKGDGRLYIAKGAPAPKQPADAGEEDEMKPFRAYGTDDKQYIIAGDGQSKVYVPHPDAAWAWDRLGVKELSPEEFPPEQVDWIPQAKP